GSRRSEEEETRNRRGPLCLAPELAKLRDQAVDDRILSLDPAVEELFHVQGVDVTIFRLQRLFGMLDGGVAIRNLLEVDRLAHGLLLNQSLRPELRHSPGMFAYGIGCEDATETLARAADPSVAVRPTQSRRIEQPRINQSRVQVHL